MTAVDSAEEQAASRGPGADDLGVVEDVRRRARSQERELRVAQR